MFVSIILLRPARLSLIIHFRDLNNFDLLATKRMGKTENRKRRHPDGFALSF